MCACVMVQCSCFSIRWWCWCVGWLAVRSVESDIAALLLLDLDVLAEPGETFEDACRKSVSQFVRAGYWDFACMRCLPSPLVAQLGSTFQTWSLAILSRSRA